jgi:hypothetical protein
MFCFPEWKSFRKNQGLFFWDVTKMKPPSAIMGREFSFDMNQVLSGVSDMIDSGMLTKLRFFRISAFDKLMNGSQTSFAWIAGFDRET